MKNGPQKTTNEKVDTALVRDILLSQTLPAYLGFN